MTNEQLAARIFALSANRGPEWGLQFTEGVMRDYGEHAWVISCGAEMLLRNQLPERAESLQEQEAQEYYEAQCLFQGKAC